MSRLPNLKNVTGIAVEVQSHKAILAFGYEGRQEQALLRKENLTIIGRNLNNECFPDLVPIGTALRFWCYRIPDLKSSECAWFVTHAIKHDSSREFSDFMGSAITEQQGAQFTPGLHQVPGTIFEVTARQGFIVSSDGSGDCDENYNVFFTANKFFLCGTAVHQNQKLSEVVMVGDPVYFNAIPVYPQENFKSCQWFATLVWQGQRPTIHNALAIPKEVGLKNLMTDGHNLQCWLYQVASNPKAMFLKTEARVMFLINHEFGVAMISMKQNVLKSALFHKSVCYFFGHNLKNCDLRKFFREGDHVKFVGVEAPPGLISKFVATQIVICKPK